VTDEPCRLLQPSILRRTPHDYQKLAIQAILDWWNEVPGPRGATPAVVRIPTGGGKTLVAVHFALDHVVSRDEPRRVLWLTHRSELRGGAIEAFENNCAYGRHEGVYLAEYGPQGQRWDGEHDPKIIVASIPSVTGKREVRPEFDALITGMNFDLVVVDECHHAATAETWQRIIDRVAQPFQRDGQLVHPRLLGLSATPFPREGISFFRREIFSISMKKLIEEGFLSRPAISVVSCGNATTIDDAIVGVLEAAEWGKTLVFTPSVDVARSLARRVTGSAYVDGNMDIGLRDRAFHGFKKGATHTLFNYGVATEGTDLPLVETVLFARATKSPVLFQQMLGRGLRGKRNGGTELCNLLFFSGPQMQEAAEVIGGWEEMIGALAESADETLERLQAMYVPPRVEPKPRPPLPTSSLHFLLVSDELPAALLGYWEQSNGMPPFLPHFMDDEELERWMTQCKAPTVDVPPASRWLRNEVVLRFVMQATEPWTYRPIPPQTDAARFALACSIGESIDELLDRVESLIEQLASLRETDRALESQLDDIVENLCARMGSRALPQIGRRAVGAASNPLATTEGEHEPLARGALDAFGELAARMEKSLFERTTNYEALRLELDEKWLATEASPQLPIGLKRRLWVSTLHLANHC
jgi:superfamily II DNA or RNA helicase